MKLQNLLTLAAAGVLITSGQLMAATTTYTTLNGDVNLTGLTNLTSATALNSTNQSVSIDYLTDSSWDTTGVVNIGNAGGTLAGTFGGGNYFAASSKIILIGGAYGPTGASWGGWSVRLLLADDSYSSAISYTESDKVLNSSVMITPALVQNTTGELASYPSVQTAYQVLDISAFDTGNIGVKGIELSSFTANHPDLTFIGVTGSPSSIPEPTSVLLSALGATGMLLRRRKH
jgi:hypothetical protein